MSNQHEPHHGGLGVLTVFREPYSEREHRYIAQLELVPTHRVVCDKPSAY
jgi:hypothetical protein